MDESVRSRDAAGTRDSILKAAKQAFSDSGADVGVREIAARAGVNPSLINRYFGSKEQLLTDVMCSVPVNFAAVLGADRARFGVNLARGLLAGCRNTGDFDPTLVMLRSLGNASATAALSAIVESWLDALAEALGGADSRLRAELILSVIAGFQIMGRVFATPGIAGASEEQAIAMLGATIQQYVDPAG